jgi:sigma-B regulation protein RsbU (phosphoserine phosphatase)
MTTPRSSSLGHVQDRPEPSRLDADRERLDHLEALTDSTLSNLAADALLDELLERVREIFDADTSAVLMLDVQLGELVARSARGIEEEVRQGVRVPLGTGFAGRIAATKQPARLDRVDATTVTNPILWEKGIEVMVGVPLVSGDNVLGVLHVGRLERRPFTENDVELLEVVGDRIASAIQVGQLVVERAATDLLERSLLPSRLPQCPGLAFATRYVAAEESTVGGDWYDLFTVPSGQLWIVVGDVAGHGVQAAVVMGRIRSALRAYTLIDAPVERVLDLVDIKVSHFEIGTIATVACAVLDPPYDRMTVAVAGHPPPALAVPGQPSAFVDVKPGPPIGTNFKSPRQPTTVDFPPDAVAAFYTDGLVERRGEVLDVGLERLRHALTPGPPHRVAAQIMHEAIGGIVPTDDIALVVMSRSGPTPTR